MRPHRHCQHRGREGGRTSPASPETGLHPVRGARLVVRPARRLQGSWDARERARSTPRRHCRAGSHGPRGARDVAHPFPVLVGCRWLAVLSPPGCARALARLRDRADARRGHGVQRCPRAERATGASDATRPRCRNRDAQRTAHRRRACRHHGDRRRRNRALRGAESRRARATPTRRRNRAERRAWFGVRHLPARRQSRSDAGIDRRHPDRLVVSAGRPHSRRSRSTRSSASRSCADRHRAFMGRTRSEAWCRYSPGAGTARSSPTRAQAMERTTPGTSREAPAEAPGPCSLPCRSRPRKATASMRSRTRRTFSTTRIPTATPIRVFRRMSD